MKNNNKSVPKRKILYIDIDGVILGKKSPTDIRISLANSAAEFLKFCISNFECYWLTTHCKDGKIQSIVDVMSRYADDGALSLISSIKPAVWNTLKTEAIDFESDFYWIDDSPMAGEIEVLKEHNAINRLIQVDTRKNCNDLKRVLSILAEQ